MFVSVVSKCGGFQLYEYKIVGKLYNRPKNFYKIKCFLHTGIYSSVPINF